MATIKSYTDLNQSRTLSDFLSHESADQTWERIAIVGANLDVQDELQYKHNDDIPFNYYSGIGVPCWSLAELLDVLPKIHGGKSAIALDDNYITYPHMRGLYTKAENLVDACVDMIENLHELKTL